MGIRAELLEQTILNEQLERLLKSLALDKQNLTVRILKNNVNYFLYAGYGVVDGTYYILVTTEEIISDGNKDKLSTTTLSHIIDLQKEFAIDGDDDLNNISVIITDKINDIDVLEQYIAYEIKNCYIENNELVIELLTDDLTVTKETKEYKARTYLYLETEKGESIEESRDKLQKILDEIKKKHPGFSYLSDFANEEIN